MPTARAARPVSATPAKGAEQDEAGHEAGEFAEAHNLRQHRPDRVASRRLEHRLGEAAIKRQQHVAKQRRQSDALVERHVVGQGKEEDRRRQDDSQRAAHDGHEELRALIHSVRFGDIGPADGHSHLVAGRGDHADIGHRQVGRQGG